MRIYFSNLTRPKKVAELLSDFYPLESLSQRQEWVAQIYGYRNWHDLVQVTQSGAFPPSPYDEDLPQNEYFQRHFKIAVAANKIITPGSTGDTLNEGGLWCLPKHLPKKKPRLKGVPKTGSDLFQIAKIDWLSSSEDSLPLSWTGSPEREIFENLPEGFAPREDLLDQLAAKIRLKPFYKGHDKDCKGVIKDAWARTNAVAHYWDIADLDEAEQTDEAYISLVQEHALMVFDNNKNPTGFVVFLSRLDASQREGGYNNIELYVDEAWAAPDDDESWATIEEAVSSTFSCFVASLFKALRGRDAGQFELGIRTESEFLCHINFLHALRDIVKSEISPCQAELYLAYDI